MKTALRLVVLILLVTVFPVLAQPPGESIGRVDTLTGKVTATRADGSTEDISLGDPVYQGDVLETAKGAAVGLVFQDESVFSLGEIGIVALDEMIYDPVDATGFSVFSLAQGSFTFVSGQIAKVNPEGMVLKTPSAMIGIRGTAAGLTVDSKGRTTVALLEESSGETGEVTVINDGGSQTLNNPFQAVTISDFFTPPSLPFKASLKDIGLWFSSALDALPNAEDLISGAIVEEAARQYEALKAGAEKAMKDMEAMGAALGKDLGEAVSKKASELKTQADEAMAQKAELEKSLNRMIEHYEKDIPSMDALSKILPGEDSIDAARHWMRERLKDAGKPNPKSDKSTEEVDSGIGIVKKYWNRWIGDDRIGDEEKK